MPDKYAEERERRSLLNKLKDQYEPGPMREQLFEVRAVDGQPLAKPSYEWMHYAGMGDVDLVETDPEEEVAIKQLLKEGKIVPTLSESFQMGHMTLRRLKHFDDVNFGLDADSSPIIFEYGVGKGAVDPIIRPDQEYDPVIDQLRRRLEYGRAKIDSDPIQLHDGPTVWPVHTDQRFFNLRERQQAYTPHARMN